MLEKGGEDQLDRSCEKRGRIIYSQGGEEYSNTIKRKKATWTGHILRRNYLLKHISKGKIQGGI